MKIDVLVCGGGCAGLGAALAAARSGASVLLVERAPFCGGIVTTVGLPSMDGFADWADGRLLVRGIALELLVRQGFCTPAIKNIDEINVPIRLNRHGAVFLTNIEQYKLLADEMLLEAGVKILYHAIVCGAETLHGRVSTIIVASKAGLMRVEPQVAIDCTGDADVAAHADCPLDPNTERMPMTMHFRMGNVAAQDHRTLVDEAAEALALAHREGKLPVYYGPGLSRAFAPDEIYVHAVRVPGNPLDPFDMTRAEIQGRRDAWTMWQYWKKYVPAFKDSYFIGSGPYIGVRESRRIAGQVVLTEQDVLASTPFDDAIATGSWYMDVHPNKATPGSASDKDDQNVPTHIKGGWGKAKSEAQREKESFESGVSATPKEIGPPKPFDIPYRTLVARKVENLLVAGRCHSATRMAASSTRVTVTAMAMGEAAGAAAGMSVRSRQPVATLNGVAVRDYLSARGAGPFTR